MQHHGRVSAFLWCIMRQRKVSDASGDGTIAGDGPLTHNGYPRGRITIGSVWRFGRPHTLIGTTISIVSVTACAVDNQEQLQEKAVLVSLGVAVLTSLLMNIYIVGLNQMTDIAIDRVNKPQLPVASGELTVSQGWGLVYGCVLASLSIGRIFGMSTTPARAAAVVAG